MYHTKFPGPKSRPQAPGTRENPLGVHVYILAIAYTLRCACRSMEGATHEIKPSPTSKGLSVIITNDYGSTNDRATSDSSDEAAKYDPLSTENDGSRLQEAFKAVSYDVHWEHNVRACDVQRMWSQIKNLKYEEVKHYRCIVFIFSGHGEQNEEDTSAGGKLVMQDGSKVRISEEFIAPVLPGKAPSIGRIPKVFIIDACRGGKKTEIVQVPRKSPKSNSKGKDEASPDPPATADEHMKKGCNEILFPIPKDGNFLVSFSTLPGCVSNDIRGDGSAWLKLLAEEIPVSDKSIDDVLTGLNKKLHTYYRQHNCDFQQPQKVSTLNDVLYLRCNNNQSHAGTHTCIACCNIHTTWVLQFLDLYSFHGEFNSLSGCYSYSSPSAVTAVK